MTKSEFDNLLSVIEPSRGIEVLSTGEKKNLYREWLKSAFKLALETGLKR